MLVLPVIGLIYAGAFGSIVWLDLGYALAVAYLLPDLVVRFFFSAFHRSSEAALIFYGNNSILKGNIICSACLYEATSNFVST